jgi:hypothetical protein
LIMFVFSIIIFACEPTQIVTGPPREYPSIAVNTLKVFYAYNDIDYHPFPDFTGTPNISGIESVQNAFKEVWNLDNQTFENKLASTEVNIINLGIFTQVINYYIEFKQINQLSDNWDVIHVFGLSEVISPNSEHSLGSTVPYYAWENEPNGKMPALAFIHINYIDNMTTNVQDRTKIKAIVSTHEIAHARGVSDFTRMESSCNTCSHPDFLKQCDHCCHRNVDNQIDNYCALNSPFHIITLSYSFPPYFCMKHKMVLFNSFRFKIATGFYFPANFCNLPI